MRGYNPYVTPIQDNALIAYTPPPPKQMQCVVPRLLVPSNRVPDFSVALLGVRVVTGEHGPFSELTSAFSEPNRIFSELVPLG